ncbi:MAG: glycine betaine/L-proline ABC transporter substrate-binding protein ProX [Pseudomonadales bacterium]|uniref:ABC superfamily (Glycine/betaine/proline transport protein) n=1 Tax=Oleiphilus messinensis TaxID=141451 RepID=A0A1Y0IF03_9GAMM|nr:glycine betaine/L-proline ABC transporter substrate-binding protein ProX [Oleiphilus messinensis]ARU58055.1 ABC superfamily (glycine/betaine/proline transport protein) [Oleiphilus messinensis]MCG8610747.1 glycine betaine/L-proline ABC transporter substrate-binding protein ProX [Pseudomonadales bacterium]
MTTLKKIACALTLVTATSTSYADSMPGKGVSVVPVQSAIAEESFQTIVLNEALKQLGYDVQPIKEVDYSAGYTSIANGDATYMAVNWYPLHNTMYDNAGGDKVFYRKGHYIEGAAQGYLVDKKTADKYGIDNIGDFKDPKIAKLFDTDGDGKADLTGCQAGWGCEGVIEHQLDAFKLRDRITHKQGQYAAIISDTIARYKEGDSIFYYTWTPYWVSGKLVPGKDVVWLEVPHSANPNGTDTKLPNGKNYGFDINSERVVANKKFAQANPAAAKLFEVAKLSVNDVSAENMLIANGEDSQKQIKQHALNWIKANQSTFNGWLDAARKAAK